MPRVTGISAHDLPGTIEDLVQQHPPLAIHDKVGYENAMEIIDALTCLPKLTAGQSRYLDTISILVGEYENEHEKAVDTSDLGPLEVLRHLMGEHGMNASDLGRLLGERSLGPKILNGDRELSKSHIRKLSQYFGVSTDLFI